VVSDFYLPRHRVGLRAYTSPKRQRFLQLLKQPPVGSIVAEPFLATADQRLVLGHTRVIDVFLPTQGEGDGVPLWVASIAFEQVIGPHCDGDLLALIDVESVLQHPRATSGTDL
jgi:hypothetical protein